MGNPKHTNIHTVIGDGWNYIVEYYSVHIVYFLLRDAATFCLLMMSMSLSCFLKADSNSIFEATRQDMEIFGVSRKFSAVKLVLVRVTQGLAKSRDCGDHYDTFCLSKRWHRPSTLDISSFCASLWALLCPLVCRTASFCFETSSSAR